MICESFPALLLNFVLWAKVYRPLYGWIIQHGLGLQHLLMRAFGLFAAFLWLFNNYLALPWVEHYLAAQFLATGITVVLNFAVHKFWIYRNH
mgnify:CR=1 FL=1